LRGDLLRDVTFVAREINNEFEILSDHPGVELFQIFLLFQIKFHFRTELVVFPGSKDFETRFEQLESVGLFSFFDVTLEFEEELHFGQFQIKVDRGEVEVQKKPVDGDLCVFSIEYQHV
jgi:hypothetical protein